MADILDKYKKAELPLPSESLTWEMYGAGLENFGKDRLPVSHDIPPVGSNELLVRTDAVGICFSDVKLITQGPAHPRITGRDLAKEPVVPGHEVSITIVGVGDDLKGTFHVGERYIVQADVFFRGVSMAYGYVLPGAMQQYGVIGPEVLKGDEGCYLLPLRDETGYVEAALAEPWACVVAAYRIEPRTGLKPGGFAWVFNAAGADDVRLGTDIRKDSCPGVIASTGVSGHLYDQLTSVCASNSSTLLRRDGLTPDRFEEFSNEITRGAGFDDIIVLGAPTADQARELAKVLGKAGLMNVVAGEPVGEDVEVDIGRVHYDNISFVGSKGPDILRGYETRWRAELAPGGTAWFIGAAGPMGQMHVQRAVELESPSAKMLCTDIDDARIEMLRLRVERIARDRGIDIRFENPNKMPPGELDKLIAEITGGKGFTDVVTLVPVPALIAEASHNLADLGVMNIYAGVPRGAKAMLPLSDTYLRQVRYIGSSGSKLSDLSDTLHLAEDGKLKTGNSAAAIGGMNAMNEGIAAVKEGRFPGKTVIFPQFPDFPLTALTDLKAKLPTVYAKLKDGMFWTNEAEEEFFRVMLDKHSRDCGKEHAE